MTFDSFSALGVAEPLRRALAAENYVTPTPIQAQAIPQLLEGRDVLGIAQTGTGKTAAFALPILQRLAAVREAPVARAARALVLAPTRELAVQIGTSFRTYGRHLGLRHAVILGGVGMQPQIDALRRGVDILVATPGRLLDLMAQGHARLDRVAVFVLDEADRMLDMGFVRDVRKIAAALPRQRQTLLFSATMPAEIARLAQELLHQPVRIEVTPPARTVDRIDQQVHFVNAAAKRDLLVRLLADRAMTRVVVFTRTKRGANRVAEQLAKAGIGADAIHGNKSQGARQRALERFRSGHARVLVATDIAARGIDIDGITHVVNFELPNEPESYVHRIGRTARAGADGVAISFCDPAERDYLRAIERLTRRPLSVVGGQPAAAPQGGQRAPGAAEPPARTASQPGSRPPRRHRSRHRFNRGRGRQAA